ncbi:hypothetical protein Lal_00037856 [Lupinus albus]|nr:hypothetical protein Lal_00037856 [Lupinus albus]
MLQSFTVKPKKGDALLFFSLHLNATTDIMSLHQSCPVIQGEKWSATKWIHEMKFLNNTSSASSWLVLQFDHLCCSQNHKISVPLLGIKVSEVSTCSSYTFYYKLVENNSRNK